MENNIISKGLVVGIIMLFIGASVRPISGLTNEKNLSINNKASSEEYNRCNSISQSMRSEAWWNNDWDYRKLITINSSMVDSTLSNFPVLINQATDSDLASHAQSDGDDIAYVLDSDNTQLNHEIEKFNSTTGELVAWVNVTSLSSSVDTKIWMYYGNGDCSSQQNPTDVWDSNYLAVYHLNETTGDAIDSTININNGTVYGAKQGVTGIIDGTYDFDGTDDYIKSSVASSELVSNFMVSCWAKGDAFNNVSSMGNRLVTAWHSPNSSRWAIGVQDDAGTKKFGIYTNTGTTQTDLGSKVSPNNWYYFVMTYNGTYINGYLNGEINISKARTITTNVNDSVRIGIYDESQPGELKRCWNGTIDEIRMSNIIRNSSWIKTSYNTMNSPDTFYTLGNEEIQSDVIVVSDPYPPDGAEDVELTPTMSITVNHTKGNQVNISWKWNNSGSWDVFGTNYNVFNGTYHQINMNFSSYLTTYEWRVEVNDGIGNWNNKTYSFKTMEKSDIIVSNPFPPNGAEDVELTPTMNITVNHTKSKQMNIKWKWNNSGSWDVFGTNYNVFNGTYHQINMNFSSYHTIYEWRVEVNDGIGNWNNKTYSFKTKGETELPTVNIIIPLEGFLYINLFGTQYEIPIRPRFLTLIIGKIDIDVNAKDNVGVKWVKFYINNELRATIYEEPYTWTWNQITIFFPFTIKAVASDYSGNENFDEINVWKIQFF